MDIRVIGVTVTVPMRHLHNLRLRMAVLTYALRRDPLLCAKALWWRARGLKVRARNAVATLAGQSPQAYRLWIATKEHRPLPDVGREAPCIVLLILVDENVPAAMLAQTIVSASHGKSLFVFDPYGKRHQIADTGQSRIIWIDNRSALSDALSCRAGQWFCAMQAGDRLSKDALQVYQCALRSTNAGLIYADDDCIDKIGLRSVPHFKSDWNSELFAHQDYIGLSCIWQMPLLPENFSLASRDPKQWITGFINIATASFSAQSPVHIPQVLHHCWQRDSVLTERTYSYGRSDDISLVTDDVTIIVPTKNNGVLLRACIEGIERTGHAPEGVIIINHESEDPETLDYLTTLQKTGYTVLPWAGPFNYSAMNNHAARHTDRDYLCFLNNDVEMNDDLWLAILACQARRMEVGAVGAKLLYPDHTIQHAGVVLGIGGAAGHAHRFCPDTHVGYFNRPHVRQFVMGVTAACMVVAKAKFDHVGGFDDTLFPVAFNDVDLCLKLHKAGWNNVYEPRATLIHHESKSRGSDLLKRNRVRFAKELDALKRKWGTDTIVDPYHNVNLSRLSEQYVIDI